MAPAERPRRFVRLGPLVRGPGGRYLCRWCEREVPPPRRTFCSKACVDEWSVRSSGSYARRRVYKRDRGVCALCGLDTAVLIGQLRSLPLAERRARLRALGLVGRRTYWDVDHIIPVVEGGGASGLDNLRTLCVPCHKRVTAQLAARRALQRRG